MTAYWPKFDSDFLEGISLSLKKRRKSFKNKVREYTLDKVIENADNQRHEKLELEISLYNTNTCLRIHFWDDRLVWIDVRKSSKEGWLFEWGKEGRAGGVSAQSIVKALESSLDICQKFTQDSKEELSANWDQIILSGPLKYDY